MECFFPVFVLIAVGVILYSVANIMESEHYLKLRERESYFLDLSVNNSGTVQRPDYVENTEMVYGSVVISLDYFKRILSDIKKIFGGRVSSYQYLLERGRREAVLRLKEKARQKGYDEIINLRFETSLLENLSAQKTSFGCFEILAYATAVKYR